MPNKTTSKGKHSHTSREKKEKRKNEKRKEANIKSTNKVDHQTEKRVINSFARSMKEFTDELENEQFQKPAPDKPSLTKFLKVMLTTQVAEFKDKIKEKVNEAMDYTKSYVEELSITMLIMALEAKGGASLLAEDVRIYFDLAAEYGRQVRMELARDANYLFSEMKEDIKR